MPCPLGFYVFLSFGFSVRIMDFLPFLVPPRPVPSGLFTFTSPITHHHAKRLPPFPSTVPLRSGELPMSLFRFRATMGISRLETFFHQAGCL